MKNKTQIPAISKFLVIILGMAIMFLACSIITHASIEPIASDKLLDRARNCRLDGGEFKLHRDWLKRIYKTQCIIRLED